LVAGNLEQTIVNVIARAPENDQLSYTLGERNGQPWFMLVYGQYPTRDAARSAANRLPDSLGLSDSWVRAFESF
jgi:DamX protein